jgi:hypothetical protein
MKNFVVGAVILILAIPISGLLLMSGMPINIAKAVAFTIVAIGGSFQVRAFWQAWKDHQRINTAFELGRIRTQALLRGLSRKMIAAIIIGVLAFNTVACSAPTKTINGTTYSDYGLFNPDDKNPNVRYEPNWWNVAMGVIFFEMIIPPIYVFGFHLFKPVGPKPAVPGQVPN